MAQTDLDPEGKVFVHGEIWQAEAVDQVPIPKGTKVKVVEVMKSLKIKVTRA